MIKIQYKLYSANENNSQVVIDEYVLIKGSMSVNLSLIECLKYNISMYLSVKTCTDS